MMHSGRPVQWWLLSAGTLGFAISNSIDADPIKFLNPEILTVMCDRQRNYVWRDVRWWNLVPGGIWQGQVILDLEINLEEHQEPEINAIRSHVRDFLGEYEICIDAGLGETCSRILDFGRPPTMDVASPDLTGGVSRISIWLQHLPPPSRSPTRVVNNVTYYQWISEIDAVEELRRRLFTCRENQDHPCEAVVEAHLEIAESRLQNYVDAQAEARSLTRTRKNVQIVTTVYNSRRLSLTLVVGY